MDGLINSTNAVLEVENLNVRFQTNDGEVFAANDVSFAVHAGKSLGIVGESGSGKSQIFMAVMGLLARNGAASGRVDFLGQDLLSLRGAALNKVRGARMSMIFQDPMTSLNPFLRVSKQLTEVLIEHRGMDEKTAQRRAIEMLDRVGIPAAASRFKQYPHEFSGGMRQRVMIAMALLCEPALLIADEPTTALDVTVQAQILDLMRELKREFNTAIVMITHDLGVVAGLCDEVIVLYGGRIMETGSVRDIFYSPRHPYTQGLLRSMPRLNEAGVEELTTIPGSPPNLQTLPPGCPFQPRCPQAFEPCPKKPPALYRINDQRASACYLEDVPK